MVNFQKILIVVVVFIGSVFASCVAESKTLKISPSKLDFGSINIGDNFTIDVVLKNKYGKTIIISTLTITGSSDYKITSGHTLPINLDNNAEHNVSIRFAPSISGVTIVALLSIEHDASTKAKELDIRGKGISAPWIQIPIDNHDFGKRLYNTAIDKTFIIRNIGSADMIIYSYTFTGSGATEYSINTGGTVPTSITPGSTHAITVQFVPTALGTYSSELEITHNAKNANSPSIITLTGEGVLTSARIALSENSYDFGIRLFNTTIDQNFDVKNVGSANMTISQLTFVGTGAAEYNVSAGGTIPINVTPGATHTITVQFAPTSAGVFPAELEIYHDAYNENSPSKITFDGVGVLNAPKIEVNRTSPWDFGSVATTMPSTQTLEISSTGSTPLTVTSITFTTGVEFTLEKVEDAYGNAVTLPEIIHVSSKIVAFIKFAPTANTSYNDTLAVIHNDIYNPSPIDIVLRGEGRN